MNKLLQPNSLLAKKRILRAACVLLSAFLCIPTGILADDYTIETTPEPSTPVLSYVIPLVTPASSGIGASATNVTSSVTQQVFLASELKSLGASAGNITGIKFYYGGTSNSSSVASVTRSIKIYITQISDASFTLYALGSEITRYRFCFKNPGTLVYEGDITTETISSGEVKPLPIVFNKGVLTWDDSNNILLTVFDVTDGTYNSEQQNFRFVLKSTSEPRFVHQYWISGGTNKALDYLSTLTGLEGCTYYTSGAGTNQEKQIAGHCYVPKTTFTIVPSIPAPTALAASSITSSGATISWTAATGADSYEVRYGTTSGSLGAATDVGNVTSYTLSDLTDETTYYYQVRTKKGSDYSSWTAEASFTTFATASHIHNDITFSKWNSTTALPASGNYYLNADVTLSAAATISGILNLCLNGHNINTDTYFINVSDGGTLALYDDRGTGSIYGFVVADYPNYGIINVQSGGTFVLSEGSIENRYGAYVDDENPSLSDDKTLSNAVYNNGTLKMSGAPTLSSYNADIYLGVGKVITIESGKPLTNTTPYTVYKAGAGAITSGWENMSGENPTAYFVSANTSLAVTMGEREAEMKNVIPLYDNRVNTEIATYAEEVIDARLMRSFTSASYNTICLPFGLDNAQLTAVFGTGYDLEAFTSSELNGEELVLTFTPVTSLTAGQPYLIQPAADVVTPTFVGVTITATSPSSTTDTNVDFVGVYSPTALEQGNRNILFLGADNTLFWNNSTNNLKGFRAYFNIKDGAARQAVRARIAQEVQEPTGMTDIQGEQKPITKTLENGQLIIRRNNEVYNAIGERIR